MSDAGIIPAVNTTASNAVSDEVVARLVQQALDARAAAEAAANAPKELTPMEKLEAALARVDHMLARDDGNLGQRLAAIRDAVAAVVEHVKGAA